MRQVELAKLPWTAPALPDHPLSLPRLLRARLWHGLRLSSARRCDQKHLRQIGSYVVLCWLKHLGVVNTSTDV